MSVIAKTPFIKKVIGSLTSEQLSALAVLIDNSGSYPTFRSLVNKDALITTNDKGVKHITLETKDRKFTGYLLYNNTYCVLVAYYNNTQQMQIIKIANNDYQLVNEELSILDFRATIIEKLKADLVNGKIPASQLPSYVDDVIEGYYYNGAFYSDLSHTEEITGETGKIYVDLATGNTYRWSGTVYAQIGGGGAKVVEVQLTAQNETDLLTNGSVTIALSAADGADLIGSELNMIKLEGASLGDMYLYKGNGGTDNSFYFLSLDTTLIGTAGFDGTDYSLYLATNQPLEVVGNPTIPAGATVNPLNALKIGSNYFNIDKPIHFIKLTSTTLTEALRSEILSDEYFVILEYSNNYYYERNKSINYKNFETIPNITITSNRTLLINFYKFTIRDNTTSISIETGSRDVVINQALPLNIAGRDNSGNAVTAGKVLTADGSGGTSWENTIPTVSIALTQVVQADPLQIQLTDAQYNVFANNKQVIIDFTAVEATAPVVVWDYADEDSNEIIFGYADTDGTNSYSNFVSINKSTKIGTQSVFEKNVSIEAVGDGHSADEGKLLGFDSSGYGVATNNLPILTTAPTEANTEGGIKIVVLSQEPATKYNGYLYLITGA